LQQRSKEQARHSHGTGSRIWTDEDSFVEEDESRKKSFFLAAKLLATFVDQSSLFHSVSETAVIVNALIGFLVIATL
jgi:hypothetical protein